MGIWMNDVYVYVFVRERFLKKLRYIGKGKVEEFQGGNG